MNFRSIHLTLISLILLGSLSTNAQDDCPDFSAETEIISVCSSNSFRVNLNITGTDGDDDVWSVFFTYGSMVGQPILWYEAAFPGSNEYTLEGFDNYPQEDPELWIGVATAASAPNCTEWHSISTANLSGYPGFEFAEDTWGGQGVSCSGMSNGSLKYQIFNNIDPSEISFSISPEPPTTAFVTTNNTFEITGLPQGQYNVTLTAPEGCQQSFISYVELDPNAPPLGLEFYEYWLPTCNEGLDWEDYNWGRVVYNNVGPYDLEDLNISLINTETSQPVEMPIAPTQSIDQIQIPCLLAEGSYCLIISKPGVSCTVDYCYEDVGTWAITEHPVVTEIVPATDPEGETIVSVEFAPSPYSPYDWEISCTNSSNELIYQYYIWDPPADLGSLSVPYGGELTIWFYAEYCSHEDTYTFELAEPIYGCLDPNACNYSPEANIDDGSCLTGIGCGDMNEDGVVNTDDLTLFLIYYGTQGEDLPSDLNNDGVVNLSDLLILLVYFGTVVN